MHKEKKNGGENTEIQSLNQRLKSD